MIERDPGRSYEVRDAKTRDAWAEFLCGWSWDLLGTHTFREDMHPDAADRCFRGFIKSLNRKLYGPRWFKHGDGVRWARGMERQTRGVIHFHSLLAGPGLLDLHRDSWRQTDDKRWNELNEMWNSLAGFARIEPVRSGKAVARYVSKHVLRGGEIDFGGPGMAEPRQLVTPAPRPALAPLRKHHGTDELLARLRSVVTEDELNRLQAWASGVSGSRRSTEDLRASVRARVRSINVRMRKPIA
jgi:hypothetical protein